MAALLVIVPAEPAAGVIILGSGDPNINAFDSNPPAGPLRNSGGQFQGIYGEFLGTPIASEFFLSAGHVNGQNPGATFIFRGTTYTTTEVHFIGGSDLCVLRVNGTFPVYAPLFTGDGAEPGRRLVAYGRGRARGSEVRFGADPKNNIPGELRGWNWGAFDYVVRWGVNQVQANVVDASYGKLIYATFDAGADGLGDFECGLADKDSSGAVFIREAGVWKLAALNTGVDVVYAAASGGSYLDACLFDCRGYYEDNPPPPGARRLITGESAVPGGFYSARVSAYLPQILSIIGNPSATVATFARWQSACFTPEEIAANTEAAAAADPEGDGLSNLAEYAFGAAPFAPSPEARPTATTVLDGSQSYAAITYRRARNLSDVTYAVEASADLQNWSSAAGTTTLVSDAPAGDTNLVTVRDNAPLGPGTLRRFLRVRVMRP